MSGFGICALGEDAVLLRFEGEDDAATNRRVDALAATIQRARPPWLRELVPAYASLALQVDESAVPAGMEPLQFAREWLQGLDSNPAPSSEDELPVFQIPTCYGGEHGPDLAAVANHAGMTAADVVAAHAGGEYRVAMLGFAPGFPYLLGLDPRLAMPRMDTPRVRVAAGSVGIGGSQTGIYPREGPGGWRIIGRTSLNLFDATRDPPGQLAPGQRVRFVAVTDQDFQRHARHRPR